MTDEKDDTDVDAVVDYAIATDTMGRDLLAALMQEVKALPDVWQKMTEEQQGNSIDRMRRQVEDLIEKAAGIMAAGAGTRIAVDIEGITIKDGVKAVLKVSRGNPPSALQELYEHAGDGAFLVLFDPKSLTGGMDDVKPEPNQRSLLDSGAVDSKDNDNHDEAGLDNDLLVEVKAFLSEGGGIGIATVQRKFKIGYNRAARVIERLEEEKFITPMDGAGKRRLVVEVEKTETAA